MGSSRRPVVSVCPSTMVEAPLERVWALITHPRGFDLWVDAELESFDPDGPARPGQRIRFRAGLRRVLRLPVTIEVRDVDVERRRLRFLAHLPFGVDNDQTTSLVEAGPGRVIVRFG